MHVFGCPVGIRHVHHILRDQVLRFLSIFSNRQRGGVHFVYFSCARDFELISYSLKSLRCLPSDLVKSVLIVMDAKAPFSSEQQAMLKQHCAVCRFENLGNIDWASLDTLKTEIRAFAVAAAEASENDWVAKIDSDVLFFGHQKIKEIATCAFDFVGDGHYSDYSYAQGGLYFLRTPLARSLTSSVSEQELLNTISDLGKNSEDRVMSSLVRRRTENRWLTRIMLFPDELKKADFSGSWLRKEFCCIHFVKGKEQMKDYAMKLECRYEPGG